MATVVLSSVEGRFPAGTSVEAYPQSGFPPAWTGGDLPDGMTSAGSAVVQADGSLTFTGLEAGVRYRGHAEVGEQPRYLGFTAPVSEAVAAVGGVGVFEADHDYAEGALIIEAGVTYYAPVAFTSASVFDADDWEPLPFDPDQLVGESPSDGEILVYDSGAGELVLIAPPTRTATGPGGVAGGNSGTAVTLPDPIASDGYGLYHLKLTGNCVVTMPGPGTVGSRIVLRATQDATGGRTLSFAASPAVIFPGVGLSLHDEAGADNWIAFECGLDGAGDPTWYGFPATSAEENLSDVADPDAARNNIRVQVLRGCLRASTTNITLSGLSTIDGHAYIDGERHLCTGQTSAAENGPWVVHSGAWTRPTDYPSGAQYSYSRIVPVRGGTYAHSLWMLSNDATVTVDTTSATWTRIDAGAAGGDSGFLATYRPILRASGRADTSGTSGVNYHLAGTNANASSIGAGTTQAPTIIPLPLDDADYTVSGKTTKFRIKATVAAGTPITAGTTVTIGLHPITYGANITLGAAVSGSTVAIDPASNSGVGGVGSDFDVPSDGDYALGYTLDQAPGAGFSVAAVLQMRHV